MTAAEAKVEAAAEAEVCRNGELWGKHGQIFTHQQQDELSNAMHKAKHEAKGAEEEVNRGDWAQGKAQGNSNDQGRSGGRSLVVVHDGIVCQRPACRCSCACVC